MKFTFTIPDYIYNGTKELAARHNVKLATVLNALIRRGLIAGLVFPFSPMPSPADDRELLKELEKLGREGEELFCDYFGVELDKLTFDELMALADGRATARAVISKYYPDYPIPDDFADIGALYRDVARWEAGQG